MEDLIKLLAFLIEKYEELNNSWEKEIDMNPYNGNKNVCHIVEDTNMLKYIHQYREFINQKETFQKDLKELNLSIGSVTRRVKDHNSIQDKIERYLSKKHGYGHVAIKKCLNDILGFRIIFDNDYEFVTIKKIIGHNFKNVKVIDSSNGDYKATHAYFTKSNNKRFVWELQMWNKSDEKNNLNSHHKHKQDYVVWEDKQKEGE